METRNHIVQFEIIMEKMYEIEVSDWGYGGTKKSYYKDFMHTWIFENYRGCFWK